MSQAPAKPAVAPIPAHVIENPECRVYIGDCRELLGRIPECAAGKVDLIFADPPFNWNRAYDEWDDAMADHEYCDVMDTFADGAEKRNAARSFTMQWLDACVDALAPHGALWINIPDTWAAEIVCHLKYNPDPRRRMHMVNWNIWHFRFGQNRQGAFINSKVHVLYFMKQPWHRARRWNVEKILEPSDRATTYFDPRTMSKKDGMPAGMRAPMDVWYGKYWGRVQGNNKERREYHDNQLPEVYLERVVLATSNEGDLVVDPFLGSGTTGVMAHHYGRRFIGVEFSKQNAQNATERIRQGPVRAGAALNQSTAIFVPRKIGAKTRARLESGSTIG